jgi:Secretion system C-terminal sorting domain
LTATSIEGCPHRHCHALTISRVQTQDLEKSIKVWLHPNPTTGLLSLEIQSDKIAHNLKVTNLTGQLILQQAIDKNRFPLNLENQPNGVYFLKVETSEGAIIKRFVIQK